MIWLNCIWFYKLFIFKKCAHIAVKKLSHSTHHIFMSFVENIVPLKFIIYYYPLKSCYACQVSMDAWGVVRHLQIRTVCN